MRGIPAGGGALSTCGSSWEPRIDLVAKPEQLIEYELELHKPGRQRGGSLQPQAYQESS